MAYPKVGANGAFTDPKYAYFSRPGHDDLVRRKIASYDELDAIEEKGFELERWEDDEPVESGGFIVIDRPEMEEEEYEIGDVAISEPEPIAEPAKFEDGIYIELEPSREESE